LLKIGLFLRQNGPLNRANLEANATVDAGGKVNPVPVGALGIFARTFMDTGNGAGIDAVGNPFADVGNNGVGHGISFSGKDSAERFGQAGK
jgi:hypothetical protein